MTLRLSTGTRTGLAGNGGFGELFKNGSIGIYSGTQPATADAAVTGTLLGTVTAASAALTQETRATGNVTITGATGSITAVTVGTFNIIPNETIPYNTSTTQTASDLADAVNRNGYYLASASGAVVTLTPKAGTGAVHNGYVVAATSTLTVTTGNIASGVNPANGLVFTPAASGTVSKSGVWSFNGVAAGTAGWFRLIGSAADAGALSTTLPRMDGSIATSGADLNLSNIAIAIGAPTTIDSFVFTVPAQ
jgi:hypothetical protein